MRPERTGDAARSIPIPESVSVAGAVSDGDIDVRLAEQLMDETVTIEDVARMLLSDALRDHA